MSPSDSKRDVAATPPEPVNILQSRPSIFYANLHPVLLLSTVLINFNALVNDPVRTLVALAPVTTALQAIYCVVCLPSNGQSSSAPAHKPGHKRKPVKSEQDIGARLVPAFLSFILTFLLSTPILCMVVILFGAPFTTHHFHTLLLALHLALLTTPQLYYVHGLDVSRWLQIASLQLPIDEVFGLSLGACVGAWIGAVPIPLDWDREWQKWPVTIVMGLYLGAMVGKMIGGLVFKGTKIKMA